jgi:hypothetical protein
VQAAFELGRGGDAGCGLGLRFGHAADLCQNLDAA